MASNDPSSSPDRASKDSNDSSFPAAGRSTELQSGERGNAASSSHNGFTPTGATGNANYDDASGLRRRGGTASGGSSSSIAGGSAGSVTEYVQAVQAWVWAYHSYTLANCIASPLAMIQHQSGGFYGYGPASLAPNQQNQQGFGAGMGAHAGYGSPQQQQNSAAGSGVGEQGRSNAANAGDNSGTAVARINAAAGSGTGTGPGAGRVFFVATYGRRFMAEALDSLIGFCLKLILIYGLMEMGFVRLDRYEKVVGKDSDIYSVVLLMQELMPLEIICKIFISCLEALSLYYGPAHFLPVNGYTPGKWICKIRIVSCSGVQPISGGRPGQVSIEGLRGLSLGTALSRSFMKNFAVGFFFPICITMYFGRNNRSMYDVASGTVVVESRH